MSTLEELLTDPTPDEFWYYDAGEDTNGVFCVESVRDKYQNEEGVAMLAHEHPDFIYFGIEVGS
jgi:hypothetical protein